jgi:hypothetical protein
MRHHSHAPDRTLASVYGGAGERFAWKAVQDLYKADRLEEAYKQALELGAGTMAYGLTTYRMIEAEWQTRRQSTTRKLSKLLTLEWIPEAVGNIDEIESAVLKACDETSRRLDLRQETPTLVTILAEEANTPWTPFRHGFCTPKARFAKICIPHYLTADAGRLQAALRHEYAHVLSLSAASELCASWLDEAVAMQIGDSQDPGAWADFADGSVPWLTPGRLNGAFLKDRESEPGRSEVRLAYLQSACLGAFLVHLRPEAALGRLLSAHSSSYWERLWCVVRNEQPTDAALRRVYGFASRELFARARAWIGTY